MPVLDTKSSLYVYLRKYKSLRRSGYGVIEKNVRYQAFHLTVTFKNSTEYANSKDLGNNGGIFLVIVAVPIYSSYKGNYINNDSLDRAYASCSIYIIGKYFDVESKFLFFKICLLHSNISQNG